jgi:predicted component of type VI protein secretion system
VSGRHGIIEIAADGFFLTDVGSTNGTLLNDAKMAANMRTRITPVDVIRLGGLELRVVPAEASSSQTPGDSESRSPHPPAPSPSAQTSDREGEPE